MIKCDLITKIVLVSIACFSLHAMDTNNLVHTSLSNSITFAVCGEYPKEGISLAQCLRENRYVRVYTDKATQQRCLQFYNNGKDALQWIIPPKNADKEKIKAEWQTLKTALNILIEKHGITKIVFLIKPEDERLKQIRKYSCLFVLNEVHTYDILRELLSAITIEYKPYHYHSKNANKLNIKSTFDLGAKFFKIIIHEDIKIELLETETLPLSGGVYSKNALSQDNSKVNIEPENIIKQSEAPPKKSRIGSYVVFGGGTLFALLLIGWYFY